MGRNLHSPLLFLFGLSVFTACQKELNFQNVNTPGSGNGTAQFHFAGGTGSCSGAVISGSYSKGTVLTDQNKVQVKVIVDSVGSYTLATANINGVIFGGSGNFTATGAQTITLNGAGTPSASGNYTYVPGAAGCTFAINVTSNGTPIAQFTLDGNPDSCTSPVISGNYKAGTALDSTNKVIIKVNVVTAGTYSVATNALNGVLFSASGTFTAAGEQTITLTGSGNPLTTGPFVFTPGVNGCKFGINFMS